MAIKKKFSMNVRITFIEDLLGTAPANPEIHAEFVASKAPDAKTMEEEVAAVGAAEVVEKSMTIFPRNTEKEPILYDYQIKGFFKDTAGILRKVSSAKSYKIKSYKKDIDGTVDIRPRMCLLNRPKGSEIESCQRPLRASTAQGERVALANSESLVQGTWFECSIDYDLDNYTDLIREWLDRGYWRGIGQWRNSGKGRFFWEELDENGKVIGGDKDEVIEALWEDSYGRDMTWLENIQAATAEAKA